jgi:UDP-glucose 4-epimerase
VKVLITGGAGFIGSHLADRLLDEDHEVLVIDNYATGRRDNLTDRDGLEIVEDTIEDADAVMEAFEAFRPDFVVHAAAAYKDPEAWGADVTTNALGTVNVVKAAQATGV